MNVSKLVWDYSNPTSVVSRIRKRRSAHVAKIIHQVHANQGSCRILDIGGEVGYWHNFDRCFLENSGVHITLVNLKTLETNDPMFSCAAGDGRSLGYADDSFDLVHSNSTIEHVGSWSDMRNFAGEVRRIAKRYYVQVPYFWFPIEPHFHAPLFHWMPEQVRARRIMKKDLGAWGRRDSLDAAMIAVQSARLLDKHQLKALFPDAQIVSEKIIGITKSIMAVR